MTMSKIDFQNVHTMIGADATIEGNIELEGGLIIYGKITGNVTTNGPVRVANSSEVNGNIISSDIQVGGIITGNITVNNRIVLGKKSSVQGDLIYRKLYIEEGAIFSGRCDIAEEK